MNRGIARRTVFEDVGDVRRFLAGVARAVRAGWIEVHAYCVLTTHFHMLVRSPDAELSRAMARIQNEYVRWFNRGRRRDGPLFRGRFRSRAVESLEYRRHLVQYIDNNSVLAKLAPTSALYPHGSARHYARCSGPPWLERGWVEGELVARAGGPYDPRVYAQTFGGPIPLAMARVVERRLERPPRAPDPLDDLLGASSESVLAWMRRKAALADGTAVDLPVCHGPEVAQLVGSARASRPEWEIRLSRKRASAWRLLEVGLRRQLCAESWPELAKAVDVSETSAARTHSTHLQALGVDPVYGKMAASLAVDAIRQCYGSRWSVDGPDSPPTPP